MRVRENVHESMWKRTVGVESVRSYVKMIRLEDQLCCGLIKYQT